MKRYLWITLFVTLTCSTIHAGLVTTLDDILLWTGTGMNRSALVVDFHDGTAHQAFVWGFRWSGSATGYDMLTAVDNAWTALSLSDPSFVQSVTYLEQAITHTGTANYFPTPPELPLSWGYYIAGGQAGTYDNSLIFLGYSSIGGGGNSLPASWTISPSGSSDRLLADGSWDALSLGSYDELTYDHLVAPSSPAYAAIPEPSSLALLIIAAGGILHVRKRFYTA